MTAATPKVAVGVVHPNQVPTAFWHSWHNLLMFDAARLGIFTGEGREITVRAGTDGLVAARNMVVETFLKTDAEYLLWIDSDMGFSPPDAYKLIAVAEEGNLPIVGGLCFISREYDLDGRSGFRTKPTPTVYRFAMVDGVRRPSGGHMYPVNALVKCEATGSAFILIHRRVFEALGEGWYTRTPNGDGQFMGEDISFCLRAREAGFDTHVFTGARTTHFKPQWVGETDYWAAIVPPPATEEVAVIVPVMNRPQNAEPFMRSLRASTGLATVYAVTDEDDQETRTAWLQAGATVVGFGEAGDPPGSFARKVNEAYDFARQPWLFLVGDDVRFRPGWLDHAQHIAKTWDAKVIGVNDLGDARTLAGEHAPHLLIARDYIDTVGASWDGPGNVCHEGYRHWYVDDEIVTAAKQRNVWQPALGSIVEHLHPLFGKGEDDPVYALGQSFAAADAELFKQRLEANR